MPSGHHHRAGGLKQSNKRNKRSKASKRSFARNAGGKIMGIKKGAVQAMAQQSKADRKNHLAQKRNAKRQALLRQKRGLDGLPPPPRVVGVISLAEEIPQLEDAMCRFLEQKANEVVVAGATDDNSQSAGVTCRFEAYKKQGNVTLLKCHQAFAPSGDDSSSSSEAVQAALDLARVCDMLLFVIDGNGPRDDDILTGRFIGGSDDNDTSNNSKTGQPQDWDHLISERGDAILSALKSQGLPTPLTVLAHTVKDSLLSGDDDDQDLMTMQSVKSIRRSKHKRQLDLKKYIGRFATTEFGSGNDKVVEVDISSMMHKGNDNTNDADMQDDPMDAPQPQDGNKNDNEDEEDPVQARKREALSDAFIRTLCSMSATPAKWVCQSPRAYLVADRFRHNADTNELQLTGFVRGPVPWDVNALVHVPNVGTYTCKCVQKEDSPLAYANKKKTSSSMDATNNESEILFSDPEYRERNEMFATPHALDGEQNLIGFDQVNDDPDGFDDNDDQDEEKFARPAGWSDYQAAWLDAVDEHDGMDNDDEDGDARDHGELADALNQKKPSDAASMAAMDDGMDLEEANAISKEERQALIVQRRKEQTEHAEFPDEVQVDEDVRASERFARYRSLKSFRKSYWDPKENLPDSYSSIYHFSSFKTTQRSVVNDVKEVVRAAKAVGGNFWGTSKKRDVMATDDNSDDDEDMLEGFVPSGSYVTITLQDVPASESLENTPTLAAVSLLEHENKVSVLHMGLSSTNGNSTNIVKSKDVLTFRCGWRTWKARPVFSQHNLNCDKHKFERFLPPEGTFFAASAFGPVTYTPSPVMVTDQKGRLVAVGSMIGADADRIVVKRIILTGYPVRVHKRTSVVKYMFYNPEDVNWFKPAGLYTKHGLQGNIMESVGEHGTMKCLFNAPIKQHDTVCLPLYKRIYPKFAPEDEQSNRLTVL